MKIFSFLMVAFVCVFGAAASAFAASDVPTISAPVLVASDPLPVDLSGAGTVAASPVQTARETVIAAYAAPTPERHMVCRGPWIESLAGGSYRHCDYE